MRSNLSKILGLVGLTSVLTLSDVFTINVSAAPFKKIIWNLDELHKYLKSSDKDDVINSIENNNLLNEQYKEYACEFIEIVSEKYPDIDLSVFNYNIKTLEVVEEPLETITSDKSGLCGLYSIYNNKIYIAELEKEDEQKYVFFHELWHALNTIYIDEYKILKSPTSGFTIGTSMSEGMTSYLTNSIIKTDIVSYPNQCIIISSLIDIYGEELIYEYFDNGVEGIEMYMLKNLRTSKINELVKLMDKDLNNNCSQDEIIKIYDILNEHFLNSIDDKDINSMVKYNRLLSCLCYDNNIKTKILKNYKNMLTNLNAKYNFEYICFKNQNGITYFASKDVFVVKISNGESFIVTNEILQEYLKTGYIHNVYNEKDEVYNESHILYSIIPLEDFILDNALTADYSIDDDTIYIDTEILKSKILTK